MGRLFYFMIAGLFRCGTSERKPARVELRGAGTVEAPGEFELQSGFWNSRGSKYYGYKPVQDGETIDPAPLESHTHRGTHDGAARAGRIEQKVAVSVTALA